MKNQETYDRTLDAAPQPATLTTPAALPNEEYYRQSPGSGRSRASSLGLALLLVGLLWLAFALFSGSPLFSLSGGSTTLIDKTVQGNRIEMDVGSADVDVRAWNGPGIRVEAIQRGGSPRDFTVDVSQLNGAVRVTQSSRLRFFPFCLGECSLSYRVAVPGGVQTLVRTSSGDISVEGADGAVELATVSGDVTARDLPKGITASTTSGVVDLGDIGGRLEVTTVSGDIDLEDGHVSDAVVKSTSGDFQYTGSLAHAGASSVDIISGNVTLRLPRDSSFRLNAGTISGELNSDFALSDRQSNDRSLSGVAGDGGAMLKIETTSGNISVERQ